jgi:hypothetical protein
MKKMLFLTNRRHRLWRKKSHITFPVETQFIASLHSLPVPVFHRRLAGVFLEEGSELRGVAEAQGHCNFLQIVLRAVQQHFRLPAYCKFQPLLGCSETELFSYSKNPVYFEGAKFILKVQKHFFPFYAISPPVG